MKKKFSKILGVGLTVALLASLILVAAPVLASDLLWTSQTVPAALDEVLETGNVTDIAVGGDGETIFAGGGALLLYKSLDKGKTWVTITTTDNTSLVAVAPDDSDIIAWADTSDLTVSVTTSGGTWQSNLGIPSESGSGANATTINDLAISAGRYGSHYIAVAGIETSGGANVWYYELGATAPAWKEINDKGGFSSANTSAGTANEVGAVAFSPNFASDEMLIAVVGEWNTGGTVADNVSLEMFSFDSKAWNSAAGFSTSYPALIVQDTGITGITAASLSLSPEYLGSDDAMRLAYVGLTLGGDEDYNGVHRMDDVTAKELKVGATIDINSVAFDGTNLVAGRYDSNIVYWSDDPTATTPTVTATTSLKRPAIDISGNEQTIVAWAGEDVVAGTRLANSAFAVSTNNGKSFSDISLIDTALTNHTDVAVSPDGSKVYLVSNDGTYVSLWRKAAYAWQRVLTVADTSAYIVRIAPDDADVVYLAEKAGSTIYYSSDAGETRWQTRTGGITTLQDLAVEGDGDVVYALRATDGKVSKSSNAGFTWGTAESSLLAGGNMIKSVGEDQLIVGGDNSWMSYSTDGNASWTKIPKIIGYGGSNAVSVTATGLASGDYIYAGLQAADKDIYRWQIGTSFVWKSIYSDMDTYKTYGIELDGKVLYVSTSNLTDSKVFRTLAPFLAPTVYWSTMTSEGTDFIAGPQGLRVSSGALYAVDTEGTDALYGYGDTLAAAGPTLVGPADGLSIKVNPVTGRALDVTLSWDKPTDDVTDYDLFVAYDAAFDEYAVRTYSFSDTSGIVSRSLGPYGATSLEFMPETTYYWKVRVASDGPIYSPFSEARSFTVEEAVAPVTEITVEPAPAPEITIEPTPAPEIIVEVPPYPEQAPVIPTYLLWTIIVIGAVLIIALIILIVRTRRVV